MHEKWRSIIPPSIQSLCQAMGQSSATQHHRWILLSCTDALPSLWISSRCCVCRVDWLQVLWDRSNPVPVHCMYTYLRLYTRQLVRLNSIVLCNLGAIDWCYWSKEENKEEEGCEEKKIEEKNTRKSEGESKSEWSGRERERKYRLDKDE